MRLFAYALAYRPAPEIFRCFADERYSLLFDSARPGHPLHQFSYICALPFETIESKNGRVTVTNSEQSLSIDTDPFDTIRQRMDDWAQRVDMRSDLPPFQGGAAGFFGYDLARDLEKLPSLAQDTLPIPDMAIGLYDKIIAFDHYAEKCWIIIRAKYESEAEKKKNIFFQYLNRKNGFTPHSHSDAIVFSPDVDDEIYKHKIKRVIDYIYAGDIFQANLSRRYTASRPAGFSSYTHYETLRQVNPAPFAAYMNFGGYELSGASPESFLSLNNKIIETRPIKGTMPDDVPPENLADSEKDHAENAMIVDLLRNDLSKICDDHSIIVPQMCGVETFTGLHHLVSIVRGQVRGDAAPTDALKACFPGGSITGAPKVRAMEIIEELEPCRRGPYCGAMGMIGFDGFMNTNIIIRTLIYTQDHIYLSAGGGIVADSTVETELMETKIKIQKIFDSFEPQNEEYQKAA